MKNDINVSFVSVFLSFVLSFSSSVNPKKKSVDIFCSNQEHVLNVEDIFRMANFFSENNQWILTNVNFLKAENDLKVKPGQNEIDALLIFEYYNSKDNEFFKTGYYQFNKIEKINSYKLNAAGGQSCTGVNCSKCTLKNEWMKNSYCDCDRVGHTSAGASYCNHSTNKASSLNDLVISKKNIKNLLIENPESLIQTVNQQIKR